MEIKSSSLFGEITEWTAGWRVAAALQGPGFLVLAEFNRSPPLCPKHWFLCQMGEYKLESKFVSGNY